MGITHRIIKEVAWREGCGETDLPPLYFEIDPELLQSFIDSAANETSRIRFTYCGYDVILRGDGNIEIDDGSKLQSQMK
ncbi:HalOD1 output domain-containing protein [Halomontanus rarus]|uniref:HalOD1 output domain-containing protein n=1 Tax=Halomontanus rarus TaxID=3034020 RepID=UPI0023E7B705|nr:HalOD1 output domain-containing protein [Halovivax sp. TS33]